MSGKGSPGKLNSALLASINIPFNSPGSQRVSSAEVDHDDERHSLVESRPTIPSGRKRGTSKPSFRSSIAVSNIEEISSHDGPPSAPPPPRRLSVADRVAKLQNRPAIAPPMPDARRTSIYTGAAAAAAALAVQEEPSIAAIPATPPPPPPAPRAETAAVNQARDREAMLGSKDDDEEKEIPRYSHDDSEVYSKGSVDEEAGDMSDYAHHEVCTVQGNECSEVDQPGRVHECEDGLEDESEQHPDPATVPHVPTPPVPPKPSLPLLPPLPPPSSSQPEVSSNLAAAELEIRLDAIAARFTEKLQVERATADEHLVQTLTSTLQEWSANIAAQAKQSAVFTAAGGDILRQAREDSLMRRDSLVAEIEAVHGFHTKALTEAMAAEKAASIQTQLLFEEQLRLKVDSLTAALSEQLRLEQQSGLARLFDQIERQARDQAEDAKKAYDESRSKDTVAAENLQRMIGELRDSWQSEGIARAMAGESRVRMHYDVLLKEMDDQMKIALAVQEDADQQWFADIAQRNAQQAELLAAFETKCHSLYRDRLETYIRESDAQMDTYETELTAVRAALADAEAKLASRQRRGDLAFQQWKVGYQAEFESLQMEAMATMEAKYESEIKEYVRQLAELRVQISTSNTKIVALEKERAAVSLASENSAARPQAQDGAPALDECAPALLVQKWRLDGKSTEEQIEALVALLDAAPLSDALLAEYTVLQAGLSDRMNSSRRD